jgi:hypothetical protein
MEIRAFCRSDEDAVVALWQEAGLTRPWSDPHADIARKLTEQPIPLALLVRFLNSLAIYMNPRFP